ncbi:MAG: response regulator [Arenicellales bacterium]
MAVKSILVVADAQTDRARLERIVSKAGYTIIRTSSGAEALASVVEEKPDLVLLDVVMDEMDGFRICRELSVNPDTRDIPIIMLSDKKQKVDRLWAEQQGAKELITKPYSSEDVLKQIRRFD